VLCESRIALPVAREQFGTWKGKSPELEAGTKGLVKDSRPRRLVVCVVNYRLYLRIGVSATAKCN
jgi:hypothetical protein